MDLIIRGGTIVTAADTFTADIGIDGGKIVQIGGDFVAANDVVPGANVTEACMLEDRVVVGLARLRHRRLRCCGLPVRHPYCLPLGPTYQTGWA